MRSFPVVMGLVATLAASAAAPCAHANLFTHVLREAGEAGGKAASHGFAHLGAVGKAAAHLKGLGGARRGALAAHATPEGHWQFVNRDGHVFTAGTPDEMQRVMSTLAPDAVAAGDSKMTLYVSEDSVFQNRDALAQLPKDAELHVVTDKGAFGVLRSAGGDGMSVQIKPHIVMPLADRVLFEEAVAYLARPFNRSNVRTVAFAKDGKSFLPSAPTLDPVSKLPLAEAVDPAHIGGAFGAIRGQTVIVTGRVENGRLAISPAGGSDVVYDLADLERAARASDVNVIVLHTDAGQQPGTLNWLWQRMDVGGLADSSKAATNGDFLDALAARRGGFQLAGSADARGRVHFALRPAETGGLVEDASTYLGETVSHVTGEIVTRAADIYALDTDAQTERDARLIPGVPTAVQYPYLISLIAGLMAWSTARGWWYRVWPTPAPASARVAGGIRRVPREIVYWLGFLPAVGLPALLIQTALQFWVTATAPFRWLYRRFLRREV